MSSQDDKREIEQKQLFKVSDHPDSTNGRGNRYIPDGVRIVNGKSYNIEFKTKPEFRLQKGKIVKKTGVSTARNFGQKKVQDWECVDAFVFSEYKGTDFKGSWKEHIVLSFDQLKPILEKIVLKPFFEGRKPSKRSPGYYGMSEFTNNVLPLLQEARFSQEDISRVLHTVEAGTSLNDPKISWKDIKAAGTIINNEKDLDIFLKNI